MKKILYYKIFQRKFLLSLAEFFKKMLLFIKT